MRATSKILALALTTAMQSAIAAPIFLDFEDLQTTELLNGQYNGVGISGAAWAATSEACFFGGVRGDVSFTRPGSCGALWLAQDPTTTGAGGAKSLTMDIAGGFIDALSFVYSGSVGNPNLKVQLFDDAGHEIGLGLSGLTGASCSSFVFCNWSQTVTLAFQGIARSVVFTATDETVLLDDIRFTTPSNANQLPEPASLVLALSALGALGWARKRQQAH